MIVNIVTAAREIGSEGGGTEAKMKVLHLIGGGDVGGAKTHVLSLVKRLGRHIGVKIVSLRPGMFADEAKELGIDIEVVKSGNIINDIRRVVSIARDGGFLIIHSHGAKANMIAIAAKALTKLPTVTTVHSDYKLDYMHSLIKRLTFGVINTVALRFVDNYIGVSNNFAEMLISRKFFPDRIFTLYNGMDFDEPPKVYSRERFFADFGLAVSPDAIIVGIAARLYPVKGLETLLKAAELVAREDPRVKFVIGGDGEDREHLESMSRALGLEGSVFFTGWLSDPYMLMSIVDISVLTSISESFPYSILEGARFAKATISTRVGGIPDLIRDNVDGLLLSPGDFERLAAHILTLAKDGALRERLGLSLRRRAMEKFSLQSMCDTQIRIYEAVRANRSRKKGDYDIIISGYYGFNNIGDDAMLMGIVENMRRLLPAARLAILSKAPVKTALTYRVNTFNRLNFPKVLRIMRHARLFIHGGGNIIQDSTSTRSLFFYLTVTLMAKLRRVRVMFFGNGFGPLIKPLNRKVSGRVLNCADVITVREELSLRELEALSVTKPVIRLTADPALLVTQAAPPETVDALFEREGIPAGRVYVGFSVRDYPVADAKGGAGDAYLGAIAKAADEMARRHGVVPVFIPMEHPRDVMQIEKVLSLMSTVGYLVKNRNSVPETLGIISRMEMMVAMRLHALIFAANLGVPVVSIEYQPKIEGFVNYIGQASAGKMENLQFDTLFALMDEVWANRAAIRDSLAVTMGNLREKAFHNAEIAAALLDGIDGGAKGGGANV
ncbi:MAG: polysaccharide pyruvyl transferase CsaB [Clostridiales bacterium]|jgi:polysaccharide pyruvyl transferase CsaB|nr:polysaccharide pyruvyl transferase CsaB [Clostridiales bacterium]